MLPSRGDFMKHAIFCLSFLMLMIFALSGFAKAAANEKPEVRLETNYGDIVVQLEPRKAPITTANFIQYVKSGHYDNTIFHRVIKDFMIQGGGMTSDMKEKHTQAPIKNEANNGLKNRKHTIAMARTSEPNSATSQFFINTKDNTFLDFKGPENWGYAVFGKVIKGQDVVDKIEASKTGNKAGYEDVPLEPVVIKKAIVIE